LDTEARWIAFQFPADDRLLTSAAGAVAHFARRAGLPTAAGDELATATEAACRDTFKLLPAGNGTIEVRVDRRSDSLEVTISHRGEAQPSVGLDTFAGAAAGEEGGITGLALLANVDRVQYQTEGGVSKMVLVKYFSGKA